MKNKILVVEDDAILLEMLEYNLVRQGYEVIKVSDGRSALTLARQEPPSLMILDVMLPGIDGFEVCRWWRWRQARGIYGRIAVGAAFLLR
jgi:two-component system alkaline phosphatase synthesis response regulator PhoP